MDCVMIALKILVQMSNILVALWFSFFSMFLLNVLVWSFEQRLRTSAVFVLVFLLEYSLLGSLMIDSYCLKLTIWDSCELGWQTMNFVYSLGCYKLRKWQQKIAEVKKPLAFVCMHAKCYKNCTLTPLIPLCCTKAQLWADSLQLSLWQH